MCNSTTTIAGRWASLIGLTQTHTPVSAQTSLHQSPCRRIDIADDLVPDEGLEGILDLGALVGGVMELGLCQKWVQDAQVCVSKLEFKSVMGPREKKMANHRFAVIIKVDYLP